MTEKPRTIPYSIKILAVLLVLFGGSIRCIRLETNPNGLYCDEAANGYDAWSLARTGKDIWGNRFPVVMNHFNMDHPESLYSYCCIPVLAVMGLNTGSLRLTTALLGTISLLILWLLAADRLGNHVALWAVLFLAVSPLHLHFSRVGMRHITAPLLMMLGFWLLHRSLTRTGLLPLAGMVLGLSANTYLPAKFAAPVLIGWHLILYQKEFSARFGSRKRIAVMALLCFLSIYACFLGAAVKAPGQSTNYTGKSLLISRYPIIDLGRNLLTYFGPDFFWGPGDPNPRHHVPGEGAMLKTTVPLFLAGLAAGIWRRNRHVLFFTGWMATGMLPAVFTWEGSPHFGRAITILPAGEILIAWGLVSTVSLIRSAVARQPLRIAAYVLIVLILGTDAVRYLHRQLHEYPRYVTGPWEFGLKEAVSSALDHREPDNRIFLTPRINQAFIFALFFGGQTPEDFHARGELYPAAVAPADLNRAVEFLPDAVYVVRPDDLYDARILDIVVDPENRVVWKVVTGVETDR